MELPKSAGAVVIHIPSRKVLMIKVKSPGTGKVYWTFPKGEIEKGENPKQTALREVQEETGLKNFQIIRKVDEFEIYRNFRNVKFHKLITMYAAYTTTDKLKPGEEVLDAKFVDFDKALVNLRWHDSDYIPSLLKTLSLVSNRFPDVYMIK